MRFSCRVALLLGAELLVLADLALASDGPAPPGPFTPAEERKTAERLPSAQAMGAKEREERGFVSDLDSVFYLFKLIKDIPLGVLEDLSKLSVPSMSSESSLPSLMRTPSMSSESSLPSLMRTSSMSSKPSLPSLSRMSSVPSKLGETAVFVRDDALTRIIEKHEVLRRDFSPESIATDRAELARIVFSGSTHESVLRSQGKKAMHDPNVALFRHLNQVIGEKELAIVIGVAKGLPVPQKDVKQLELLQFGEWMKKRKSPHDVEKLLMDLAYHPGDPEKINAVVGSYWNFLFQMRLLFRGEILAALRKIHKPALRGS